MPDKVVLRSKIAEGIAIGAAIIAVMTSTTVYFVNSRAIDLNTQSLDRIQESRVENTLQACKDTNERYTKAVAYLTSVANKQKAQATSDAQRAQIDKSLAIFKVLINDLTPKQDCNALVKKRFS